jgi:hypothetical protein
MNKQALLSFILIDDKRGSLNDHRLELVSEGFITLAELSGRQSRCCRDAVDIAAAA